MTQFYQAFPRVSIASDKRWGEKAWVRALEIDCGNFTEEDACILSLNCTEASGEKQHKH